MTTETPERSTSLRTIVAEEVRAWLGRRTMSNIELARRLSKSHTYVGRRLSGETPWDVDDLEQIAAVLGVSVTTLIRRNGGATEGYAPTGPKVDPLAVRVVATMGQANRRPGSRRPVGRGRKAVRTGRPAGPAGASRPVTPVPVG
jgi:hypothetical protein